MIKKKSATAQLSAAITGAALITLGLVLTASSNAHAQVTTAMRVVPCVHGGIGYSGSPHAPGAERAKQFYKCANDSSAAAPQTSQVGVTFQGGRTHSYPCSEGSTFHTGFPGRVIVLDNECGVRVWLHQNNNNSGVSLCFNPHTTYAVNSVTFVNINVTNNSTACP